jgi:3-oxoacyl-[acyl-carrier-protein] synthase-3
MIYSRIVGTGSYLPERILTNAEIEKMVDTKDEWIRARTGIKQRHIAARTDTASSMGTQAALKAIEAAGCDTEAIDFIIVATSTPDKIFPSTACLIQERLNIHGCPAFDVVAACAGFNYALGIADQYIRTGSAKLALVVGSEVMSRIVDWNDRGTCILFGDGAGAVLLAADPKPGIHSTHLRADGSYKDLLYTPNPVAHEKSTDLPYMKMLGGEVFKAAVSNLQQIVTETLVANQLPDKAVDWLIPHQANMRIIKAVARKLNLSLDKVVITVDRHGNTSAASIPLALDEAVRDGRIKRGDLLLLESFGGGFTWGSALITY